MILCTEYIIIVILINYDDNDDVSCKTILVDFDCRVNIEEITKLIVF